MTRLFCITDNTAWHNSPECNDVYAWASIDPWSIERVYGPCCTECNVPRWVRYTTRAGYEAIEFDVEGGAEWPDIIATSTMSPPFLISEKVLDALEAAGVVCFEKHPAQVKRATNSSLRVETAPRYFHLDVLPTIELDWEASGTGGLFPCGTCGRLIRKAGDYRILPERYVPRMDTWDGSDLIVCPQCSAVCCTEKVILLAREHRWTNLRFVPMDALQRWSMGWPGIDYLGPTWPPKWYPDPPYAGKSAAEWVEELCSADQKRWRRASDALAELFEETLPLLAGLLEQGDPRVQERAAVRILDWRVLEGYPVPVQLAQRCRDVLVKRLGEIEGYDQYLLAGMLSSYHELKVIQLTDQELARINTILRLAGAR